MKLCVFGIVKNEITALPRMIESCEAIADRFFFVDTGSTDGTVKYLKWKLGESAVVERPWVNFGQNLTEAVAGARTCGDWLLRVDADQTLEVHPNFRDWMESAVHPDAYNVKMSEATTTWRLPRLLSAKRQWRFIGPTHEYLDTQGAFVRDLNGLTIRHHADGSNRKDKFERDIALLAPGVKAQDPRSIFYTADALMCLGRNEEAIEMFMRRSKMEEGWEEEGWYAYLMAGKLMLGIDPTKGMLMLQVAHERRPSRGEPRKILSDWCLRNLPKQLPDDILFVDTSAYALD